MKRVRIFRDWIPSAPCDFDYKDFKIVTDNSYDYAILFNTPTPALNIPKERVFGLLWEPKCSRNMRTYKHYAEKNIGCYALSETLGLGEPYFEHHTFMANFQKFKAPNANKHTMCIVASDLRSLPGHKKRHSLINKILKTDMDIHIYGRNIDRHFKDKRVKGGFKNFETVYPNYMFDITIENVSEGALITEKITRPIVSETVPIYWGSKEINNYISDCFYDLPENDDECIDLLKEIYANPQEHYQKKKEVLLETKKNLLDFNYFDLADYYFENGSLVNFKM